MHTAHARKVKLRALHHLWNSSKLFRVWFLWVSAVALPSSIAVMLAACCQKEVCRVRVCRLPLQSWLNMLAYLVNLGITYGSLTGAFGATNEELSEKYQTLVTPAGYAFAIWGAIFTWEGIFAVAQMFPSLSTSPVVDTITPWWIFACCFQVGWTLFFAQEMIPGSLVCMLGILLSLLTGILRTDYLPEISVKEYFLLRAPFSLHCGWIIAASALNINVLADYNMSSSATLLMFAMVPRPTGSTVIFAGHSFPMHSRNSIMTCNYVSLYMVL